MRISVSTGLPALLLPVLLLAPSPGGGDPWKALLQGGTPAEEALGALRKGGAPAMRDFLAAGLTSKDRKVRLYCAQSLPMEVLREEELEKVFSVLLSQWGREEPDPPLPETLQEKVDELTADFLEGRRVSGLEAVAGWRDEARILRILAGLERGKAAWGKSGKAGRKARNDLALLLFPASDAAAQRMAARVLSDKKRDPRETAPARWISLGALAGGGYPGDQVIRSLLEAFLAAAKKAPPSGRALSRRIARVYQALPALTRHYRALPLLRNYLLRTDGEEALLLWAALTYLERKAPPKAREAFWKEGVKPFTRFLGRFQDRPEEAFYLFQLLAPALGGARELEGPSPKAVEALAPFLVPLLRKIAAKGELTDDLFSDLLKLGNGRILAEVLEAAPKGDLDSLLEEAEDLLKGTVTPAQARKWAASSSPPLARLGKAALQVLDEDPRNQPDQVLARLAPIPATDRPGLLEEALRRGVVKDLSKLHGWWKAFVEEDSDRGARIARAYPQAFRSWLSAAAAERQTFQEALVWCAEKGVKEPFAPALPAPVRKALEELPRGEVEGEVPPALAKIAAWLAPGDRAQLGPVLFRAWAEDPEKLDTGSPEGDLLLLRNLFKGREKELVPLLKGALAAEKGQRVCEVCLGGLVRLGSPPAAKDLEGLFTHGIRPTEFMKLQACGPAPLLPVLEEALRPLEDEGWDLFFPLAWKARRGDGPGPLLPSPPEPKEKWWDLARQGRFQEIYLDLLKAPGEEQEAPPLGPALRGLALSAGTEEEKTRALEILRTYLEDPAKGGYWDALPGAAYLGDEEAKKVFRQALAAGRRFFVQDHLLPWIQLERGRKWIPFLFEKGLPASGILGGAYQEALSSLLPQLDPRIFPKEPDRAWADAAAARIAAAGGKALLEKLSWDPLLEGWRLP